MFFLENNMADNGRSFSPKTLAIALVGAMLAGIVFGYAMRGGTGAGGSAGVEQTALKPGESDGHSRYVCPMMCIPPMDRAGTCPICGMELVGISGEADAEGAAAKLELTAEAMRLAEIRTAPVERKFVSAEVRLFGKIDYDPAHVTYITAFTPGVIDRVYVKRAGQFVRWGDALFDIYSSDLLQTQQQLVEATRYVPSFLSFQDKSPHVARDVEVQPRQQNSLTPGERTPEVEEAYRTVEAIRHKLRILGMPKRDIDELMKKGEATGIATVYAPMYGQITEQNAFEGTYVNTGTPIFTIADPQFVWVKLDAYEIDFPWIRKGQEVDFQTDAYPGEVFQGKVVFIDPVFNSKARTFSIAAVCSDKGGRLKAGMLVRAVIRAQLTAAGKVYRPAGREEQAPLVIPASAPLITGKRAVVYVALPDKDGVFEGREVLLGPKAKDSYVVLGGLEEGERVVVNGNFKIDSAVQILAKSSMLGIGGDHSAIAHNRPGSSDAVHQDYWDERTESRMQALQGDDPVGGKLQHDEASRSRSSQSIINRRRPGTYGDTTRPIPPRREN